MDFCRNISFPGGLPSEYEQEKLFSPSCSMLGSLDDLFSSNSTEGDVELEWLSVFVEDCFSSSGNCLPPAAALPTKVQSTTASGGAIPKSASVPMQLLKSQRNPTTLQTFVIPGKARSKRKRGTQLSSWSLHLNPQKQALKMISSDPPLLQQAYWLADSELILPRKEETRKIEEEEREKVNSVMMGKEGERLGSLGSSKGQGQGQGQQQQPRKCSHCLAQKTPQWRGGPLGPKTLCNACGVRYKSGRLLPEYRPAKSPTFVSYKHSNSHKKVLEMRNNIVPSLPNS